MDFCREEITRNLLHVVAHGTLQSRKSERSVGVLNVLLLFQAG